MSFSSVPKNFIFFSLPPGFISGQLSGYPDAQPPELVLCLSGFIPVKEQAPVFRTGLPVSLLILANADGNNHGGRVTHTNNQPFIGTPKTKSGYRSVPILNDLLVFLSPLEKTGYIVHSDDPESPMSLTSFRWMTKRIHETIDLHGATPHVFRHTMGTMLNDIGADVKTIQSILGQSDFKTTMDRYVHPREDRKQIAIQNVSALLNE